MSTVSRAGAADFGVGVACVSADRRAEEFERRAAVYPALPRGKDYVRSPSLVDGASGTSLPAGVPMDGAGGPKRHGAHPGPEARAARGRSIPLHTIHLRPAPLAPAGTSRGVPVSHTTATTATKEQG